MKIRNDSFHLSPGPGLLVSSLRAFWARRPPRMDDLHPLPMLDHCLVHLAVHLPDGLYPDRARPLRHGWQRAGTSSRRNTGLTEYVGYIAVGTMIWMWQNIVLWDVGFSLRNEQMRGTLESNWLSPTWRFSYLLGSSVPQLVSMLMFMVVSASGICFLLWRAVSWQSLADPARDPGRHPFRLWTWALPLPVWSSRSRKPMPLSFWCAGL